jgi:signal transduction histidine kinase
LYLVKYFVELHGGRVFLESRVADPSAPDNHGTKIGFSIPVASQAPEIANGESAG